VTTTRTDESSVRRMAAMSAPGDVIRALRYGTFEPLGDLPLATFECQGMETSAEWAAGEGGHTQGGRLMARVLIEVSRPPEQPVKVGDRLVPRKFLPERFAIRNSRFHDTRARGLLVMASNGVIENNVIERTYLSGIQLCHEIPGFGGADWVSNVDVRNNQLHDVCIMGGPGVLCWSAIALCNSSTSPRKEPPGAYPWATGHRNVNIVGNTIDRCYGAGILVNGLDGGTVKDNIIRQSNQKQESSQSLSQEGVTAVHPITVMNSRRVELLNNQIKDPGPFAQTPWVHDLGVYPPAR
jgi:parallel beta-helix repeat protein